MPAIIFDIFLSPSPTPQQMSGFYATHLPPLSQLVSDFPTKVSLVVTTQYFCRQGCWVEGTKYVKKYFISLFHDLNHFFSFLSHPKCQNLVAPPPSRIVADVIDE